MQPQYARLIFVNADKNHIKIYLQTPSQSIEQPDNFRLFAKFYTSIWAIFPIDGGKYRSKLVRKKKSCAEATLELLYKKMPQVRKFDDVEFNHDDPNAITLTLHPRRSASAHDDGRDLNRRRSQWVKHIAQLTSKERTAPGKNK